MNVHYTCHEINKQKFRGKKVKFWEKQKEFFFYYYN